MKIMALMALLDIHIFVILMINYLNNIFFVYGGVRVCKKFHTTFMFAFCRVEKVQKDYPRSSVKIWGGKIINLENEFGQAEFKFYLLM